MNVDVIFRFTEENWIYRSFVLQNGVLKYDTSYIYVQLVGIMEHIQVNAWAHISQFFFKFSSISQGVINCQEIIYDKEISEYF